MFFSADGVLVKWNPEVVNYCRCCMMCGGIFFSFRFVLGRCDELLPLCLCVSPVSIFLLSVLDIWEMEISTLLFWKQTEQKSSKQTKFQCTVVYCNAVGGYKVITCSSVQEQYIDIISDNIAKRNEPG